MSQPEESRAKTADTDDVLLRVARDGTAKKGAPRGGAREPDEALRPPDEELPETERRHSKPQHKLTG
ncbi:hypothetical protein GCM10023322_38540 [Rugosimonospora acidiphila]|uniref:Uncharacterized protein n=1 Tax=Rugosimonospora acidiphila TaxID=556531 RepID=A0ABP9RXA5_9ACTN